MVEIFITLSSEPDKFIQNSIISIYIKSHILSAYFTNYPKMMLSIQDLSNQAFLHPPTKFLVRILNPLQPLTHWPKADQLESLQSWSHMTKQVSVAAGMGPTERRQ